MGVVRKVMGQEFHVGERTLQAARSLADAVREDGYLSAYVSVFRGELESISLNVAVGNREYMTVSVAPVGDVMVEYRYEEVDDE